MPARPVDRPLPPAPPRESWERDVLDVIEVALRAHSTALRRVAPGETPGMQRTYATAEPTVGGDSLFLFISPIYERRTVACSLKIAVMFESPSYEEDLETLVTPKDEEDLCMFVDLDGEGPSVMCIVDAADGLAAACAEDALTRLFAAAERVQRAFGPDPSAEQAEPSQSPERGYDPERVVRAALVFIGEVLAHEGLCFSFRETGRHVPYGVARVDVASRGCLLTASGIASEVRIDFLLYLGTVEDEAAIRSTLGADLFTHSVGGARPVLEGGQLGVKMCLELTAQMADEALQLLATVLELSERIAERCGHLITPPPPVELAADIDVAHLWLCGSRERGS
jgi:hypothetical protein